MPSQTKINNYAFQLLAKAHATIHDEELLENVKSGLTLYKKQVITKHQLDKIYNNSLTRMLCSIEDSYYKETLRRSKGKDDNEEPVEIFDIQCKKQIKIFEIDGDVIFDNEEKQWKYSILTIKCKSVKSQFICMVI